jgi:hypothetical protein
MVEADPGEMDGIAENRPFRFSTHDSPFPAPNHPNW